MTQKNMKHAWPPVRVGDLFDVQLGKMLSPKAKKGEQLPYLANFNVRWGAFNFKKLNSMNFSKKDKERYSLKSGDLLMCEGGEIGRCAIWNNDIPNCYYQKALHRLRPKNPDTVSPYYFYFYMQFIASNYELVKLVGESSIAHLTREKLCELKINLPSFTEQERIVEILKTWGNALEKIEVLITAKEKQYRFLQDCLIVNTSHNKDWTMKPLRQLTKIKKGEQLNRRELEDKGTYPAWNGGITPSGYTDVWNTEENTITISEGGNSCGFINYCLEKFWCGGHCYALILLDNHIDGKFLYYYLKAHEKNIMRLRVGSGLPNIQRKDLENFEIRYPSMKKQKEIVSAFNAIRYEIEILKKKRKLIKDQKLGLMQKLLTGEWPVKIDNKKKEAAK